LSSSGLAHENPLGQSRMASELRRIAMSAPSTQPTELAAASSPGCSDDQPPAVNGVGHLVKCLAPVPTG
jgi:hypothetical protein